MDLPPPPSPPVLVRLRRYISQMAPHHRHREGGKLIIEAAEIIERFIDSSEEAKKLIETYQNSTNG